MAWKGSSPARGELYIRYGDGMANSKRKLPAAKSGTARNVNPATRLVAMARA